MKLNIGAGSLLIPGYINIDIRELPGIDVVTDVRDLSMYLDNSVDELFAKDVLEHMPRREWRIVLNEWIRVIKPGGILKIRFPDMLKLVEKFKNGGFDKNRVYGKTDIYDAEECRRFGEERLGQLLFGDQNVPENAHLSGLTEWLVVRHLKEVNMTVLKIFNDGGADVRITASKGEPDLSISLDHPDYALK